MSAAMPHENANASSARIAARAGWFKGFVTLGYGASLLLHVVLLVALSVVVYENSGGNPAGMLWSAVGSEGDGFGEPGSQFESPSGDANDRALDNRMDAAPHEPRTTGVTMLDAGQLQPSRLALPTVPTSAGVGAKSGANGVAGKGAGGREGEFGGGFTHAIPTNGRAVIRGNFAAWTVPEDPKPKEPYKIVIQIKLPEHVKTYALTDLSGLVEGTDQYKQTIPQTVRGFLPVVDHQTQMVVEVPGAEALVKDTIFIRSRILSESQTLEIVF